MTKDEFISQYQKALDQFGKVSKMVVAVSLPTGAKELIINSDLIGSKIAYYESAYNDEMKLNNNLNIQIVDVLFA